MSHATSEQCEAAVLGISSRVNCIINPQAVKRQAWLEFTLEPSHSHRHNLALCVCVSDTTLLISPQHYLRENVITQIWAHSCVQGISSSLRRVMRVSLLLPFFTFSHRSGVFLGFFFWEGGWAAVGSNMRCCWRLFFSFSAFMFIFTRIIVGRTQYYEWKVVERSHHLPAMKEDTHTAAQVQACRKKTPP